MAASSLSLSDGFGLADITYQDLWVRYLALGGLQSVEDMRRHIDSGRGVSDHEHNLIAQTINEVFLEFGGDHPVAYRHLPTRPDPADGESPS